MTTVAVEAPHNCPLHAGIDPDDFNAYDRRWLAGACSELDFMETERLRSEAIVKRTRTRLDPRSAQQGAEARRQLEIIRVRGDRLRAEMRRVIEKLPVPPPSGGVDLWER